MPVDQFEDMLRAQLEGLPAGIVNEGQKRIPVMIRSDDGAREDATRFADLQLTTPTGELARVSDLARIEKTAGPIRLDHESGSRYALVQAFVSGRDLVGYVDDLVINPSLNYAPDITRDWKPAFEISSALGQVEAVRAGAGIGILHAFIARLHDDLVPVLPEKTIRRAYWLSYHESVRSLRRIHVVATFISDAVAREAARF